MRPRLLPLACVSVFLLILLISSSAMEAKSHRLPNHLNIDTISRRLSTEPTAYEDVRGTPYKVSYDHRAILINGERILLQAGSIHYPRMSPEMWPIVLNHLKTHGINIIQSYVFWNEHEDVRGMLDFSTGNRNLTGFLSEAAKAGLFVNLRIGPYICAEWSFGGLPIWLKFLGGIEFRTMNTPWLIASQTFVQQVVKVIEPYLARNGGPIIMAQIENEYSNIEGSKSAGKDYVIEQAAFAVSLNIDIPWIMCSQADAPDSVINTCNGYYCDGFPESHAKNYPDQPHMWTEDWNGGPQYWGDPFQHRPVFDLNFAIARWFMKGGTYHSYYMVYGGTNFGRRGGGPGIRTSYDYDAAVTEYGLPNPNKFNISRSMHMWLQYYSKAIVAVETIPPLVPLGTLAEGNTYGAIIFLANIQLKNISVFWPANSTNTYHLPAWSVSFVDGQTGLQVFNTVDGPFIGEDDEEEETVISPRSLVPKAVGVGDDTFLCYADTYGLWNVSRTIITTGRPLEQINVTHDESDYLFYITFINITSQMIQQQNVTISIKYPGDYLSAAIQQGVRMTTVGVLDHGVSDATPIIITLTPSIKVGPASLVILSQTLGLQHIGTNMEAWTRGLQSDSTIAINGVDITDNGWIHQSGLSGEYMQLQNTDSSSSQWQPTSVCTSATYRDRPLVWYRARVNVAMEDDAVYAVDMGSMWKGALYVNGHHLGRYYLIVAQGQSGECAPCDYRGTYSYNKCSTGCGEPTQRYWHLPREWMVDGMNEVTVQEESALSSGVAPAEVSIVRMN